MVHDNNPKRPWVYIGVTFSSSKGLYVAKIASCIMSRSGFTKNDFIFYFSKGTDDDRIEDIQCTLDGKWELKVNN